MSQVIGQLRRAPPHMATSSDGQYSSIDLVRTAGARARLSEGDGGQDTSSPGHVYGPLLVQKQSNQEAESAYAEIGMH